MAKCGGDILDQKRKILIVVALLAILGGVAVVAAIFPIWSPSSGPVTASTIYQGTLGAIGWTDGNLNFSGNNPSAVAVGDTLTLTTILGSTPVHAQTVSFYYTEVVSPTSTTPIGNSSGTQLVLINTATATPPQSGSTSATTTWVVPSANAFYFIAEIVTPA